MYIIWGAGIIGKRIVDAIGEELIVGFIDSDVNRQGKCYCGKPILSFDSYLNQYKQYEIIIAVRGSEAYKDIQLCLQANDIDIFHSYLDLPIELLYNGEKNLLARLLHRFCNGKYAMVFGDNLYGRVVLELLQNVLHIKCKSFSLGDTIASNAVVLYCGRPNGSEDTYGEFLALYSNCNLINVCRIADYHDRKNKLLEKFHNIHCGDRCFIVGTGPSLLFEDLEKLYQNREISFSVNNVYRCFDKTLWRPTYYVTGDSNFQKIYGKEVLDIDVKYKFIVDMDHEYFPQQEDNLYEIYMKRTYNKDGLIKFSDDITKGVYGNYKGGCIISTCLHLAIYMGFKKIYLLGTDCDYDYDGKHHFIENYFNDDDNYKIRKFRTQGVFEAYQSIKYYAETHGIKIYNATRGGMLEIFERVEFDKLFPIFSISPVDL